jgi:hypothetical protein
VRAGQHLDVPQLNVLRRFYQADWTGMKHVWLFPIGFSFAMCLAVVFAGTALSYRAAASQVEELTR